MNKLAVGSVTDSFVAPRWWESERKFWKIRMLRLEFKRKEKFLGGRSMYPNFTYPGEYLVFLVSYGAGLAPLVLLRKDFVGKNGLRNWLKSQNF